MAYISLRELLPTDIVKHICSFMPQHTNPRLIWAYILKGGWPYGYAIQQQIGHIQRWPAHLEGYVACLARQRERLTHRIVFKQLTELPIGDSFYYNHPQFREALDAELKWWTMLYGVTAFT